MTPKDTNMIIDSETISETNITEDELKARQTLEELGIMGVQRLPSPEASTSWTIDCGHSHSCSSNQSCSHGEESLESDCETSAEDHQKRLRLRIIAIQKDSSLNASEKAKRVQELMSRKWEEHQKKSANNVSSAISNRLRDKLCDYSIVTDSDKTPSYFDEKNRVYGCKHYQRGCKLQAHCCGKWFPCRFCHDEVSDHTIVRSLTSTMMCMHCSFVQPAAQKCVNCSACVAKYYCDVCKLWDSDPTKNIYHCNDCGICRIGQGLGKDYFHCKKCNVCMAISLQGNHKCIERNLESDCPICGEYMFTSTTTVIFMPCGHCIHYKCHQEYIKTNYQCPTCFKSLANMSDYFNRIDEMLAAHEMPAEYKNWVSFVLCNDCERKSEAKYHFLYHKCAHCSSYNTKILKNGERKPGQSDTLYSNELDGARHFEGSEQHLPHSTTSEVAASGSSSSSTNATNSCNENSDASEMES